MIVKCVSNRESDMKHQTSEGLIRGGWSPHDWGRIDTGQHYAVLGFCYGNDVLSYVLATTACHPDWVPCDLFEIVEGTVPSALEAYETKGFPTLGVLPRELCQGRVHADLLDGDEHAIRVWKDCVVRIETESRIRKYRSWDEMGLGDRLAELRHLMLAGLLASCWAPAEEAYNARSFELAVDKVWQSASQERAELSVDQLDILATITNKVYEPDDFADLYKDLLVMDSNGVILSLAPENTGL